MCKKKIQNHSTKDKEVIFMPTVEMIELEKTNYIKDMTEYLNKLKKLTENEAKRQSYQNLLNSGIIEKDGKYSMRYKYSRANEENKKNKR